MGPVPPTQPSHTNPAEPGHPLPPSCMACGQGAAPRAFLHCWPALAVQLGWYQQQRPTRAGVCGSALSFGLWRAALCSSCPGWLCCDNLTKALCPLPACPRAHAAVSGSAPAVVLGSSRTCAAQPLWCPPHTCPGVLPLPAMCGVSVTCTFLTRQDGLPFPPAETGVLSFGLFFHVAVTPLRGFVWFCLVF